MTISTGKPSRRFAVEELDNGYLVKITEGGGDKFVARYCYRGLDEMLAELGRMMKEPQEQNR